MAGQAKAIVWDASSQRAFDKAIERGFKAWGDDVRGTLERIATHVQNEARLACPVDTGRLRSSIHRTEVKKEGRNLYVLVGTNVTYAPFVEFGTHKMRPQPYLRPAMLSAYGRFGK